MRGTLQTLYINDNNIYNKSLTFDFVELRTLSLKECSISTWPNFSAPKLSYLNINSNFIKALPAVANLPALEKIILKGNNLSNTFQGSFLKGLDKLSHLDMIDCGMTVFPNISSVIDTLTRLELGDNPFGAVDPLALLGVNNFTSPDIPINGYPLLETLELFNNDLTHFPEELFKIFPNIKSLHISGENSFITNVPNFSLLQNSLEFLDVHYNKGPYSNYPCETIFQNMSRLKEILMYNNEITSFPFSAQHIITHLPQLEILNLERNWIENLPDLTTVGSAARAHRLEVSIMHCLCNIALTTEFLRKEF